MISERPRSAGVAYSALTIALLILISMFALTSRTPPPPAIAEFAPQAIQNISDSPDDQSSSSGTGEGTGAGEGGASSTPTPAVAVDIPRVRKCVGDPPRQIEDPQSPPCVPFWTGDNGGATSAGVTRDTVTIASPGPDDDLDDWLAALESFFNKRFEFYGRRLVLRNFKHAGNHADAPPIAQMRSHAVAVDEQLHAFASMNYTDNGGGEMVYYEELARRRIISVANESLAREGESYVDHLAPYHWRTLPGIDSAADVIGEWLCKRLTGRPAVTGGGAIRGKDRRFGLLVTRYTDGVGFDVSKLQQRARACGAPIVERIDETYVHGGSATAAQTTMAKFVQAGVTSIICICEAAALWLYDQPAADSQRYEPEWIISSFGGGPDWDFNSALGPKSQVQHSYGLSFYNKSVETKDLPVYWAVKEGNPSVGVSDVDGHHWTRDYQGLLILASGIQMAGPKLTPNAFQSGLFKTVFPNPNAGTAPYYQSRVGFGPHHHFHQDSAEIWYGVTESSTWGIVGAWCWSDHGRRYSPGRWPAGNPALFSGSCY